MIIVAIVVAVAVIGGLGFMFMKRNADPSVKSVEAAQNSGSAMLPDGQTSNSKGGGTGGKSLAPAN